MLHRLGGLVGLALALLALPVQGQDFTAPPIALDLAEGDGADAPLLIAGLTPEIGAAPVITRLGSGTRLASLTPEGLPRPSIIIGRIEPGQEAVFGIETLLPESVTALAFGWRNLEAREALRARDPALFAQLVSAGHVDPPANELAIALQTDLARMNCYRSGIDGAWGPGSRRSVGEYFDQLGEPAPGVAATPELYRAVMIGGDVACPTPVSRQPVVRQPSATTANRPPAAQQPSTSRPPSTGGRTFGSGGTIGSGVVR